MKKILFTFVFILACILSGFSQQTNELTKADLSVKTDTLQSKQKIEKQSNKKTQSSDTLLHYNWHTAWQLDKRTGERYIAPMDTAIYNYQQTTVGDGYSVATGNLGYIGSPIYSKLFFDQSEKDYFIFYDTYRPYNKYPEKRNFYNMRVPYSRLSYQTAGSGERREERFTALMTSNFGKKLNVGFEFDYINARGYYAAQSAKHVDWELFGNYISDRLEFHLFASTANIKHFENGGIVDDGFITNPDSIQGSFKTLDIPVYFKKNWNQLKTYQVLASGRYNLGYRKPATEKDKKGEFVPVASLTYTTNYREQYRKYYSTEKSPSDTIYADKYYSGLLNDSTRYTNFTNTVALSLREGFRKWVKFGLTGFVEHQYRRYNMLDTLLDNRKTYIEQGIIIGGVLKKQRGENLRFNFQGDLGAAGHLLGETRLMGNVTTGFRIAGRLTEISAEAYIKNLKPKYLENNYQSKYFWWNNNFGDTRRVYIGGKMTIPFINTMVNVGVENIQNYIYLNDKKTPVQESANIQVLSARVMNHLPLGIFNWDNDVVYQTSSNQAAIPLPKIAFYSNMYLHTKIAKELDLQFGVDAHFHTLYFAPGYEPALNQFYNQRKKQIGNYPISTVYANMHLKQTRFFVMLYNVAPLIMKPDYFSVPHYPLNPMMLRLGVSVNLHN